MRTRITVVGAGNVGAAVAQRLAERDRCDLVLVDVAGGLAAGRALDLLQAGPILGHDSRITGGSSYAATAGSAVVVITGGAARRPGMSRDELAQTNAAIVGDAAARAVAASPGCVLLVVTNPLDAMAQVALSASGLPPQRVIGMAGILDAARFRSFLAAELSASVHDVQALVLGGHGDSMVPLLRLATVAGAPVTELIAPARLEQIVQRVRDGGAEIVDLVRSGSAFYAPSAAVAQMVSAILGDSHQVLPCSVLLEGEYGISGVFSGVPCRLGAGGVVEIVQLSLDAAEAEALQRSAAAVRQTLDRLRLPGRVPGP